MNSMALNIDRYVSVTEAAEIIGCTVGRVRQMLLANEMEGEKLSEKFWVIDRREAEKIAKSPRKIGRPRSGKKSG